MPDLQLREAKVPVPYRVSDDGKVSFATDLMEPLTVTVKYENDTGVHEHTMTLRSPTVRDIIISNNKANQLYNRRLEEKMYDLTVMKWMMAGISDNPIPNDQVENLYRDDIDFLIGLFVENIDIRKNRKPFEVAIHDPTAARDTRDTILVRRHTFKEDKFAMQASGNTEGENRHEYQAQLALACFRFLDKDNQLVPLRSAEEVYKMPWVSYYPALSQAFGPGMWRSFDEILESTHIEAGGEGHEPFQDVPREAN